MTLQPAAGPALTHASSPDDRCVVIHSPSAAFLTFFSAAAESNPSAGYVTFSVGGYRGPGTYKPQGDSPQYPTGSPDFVWSLSQWKFYGSPQVTVAVMADDGKTVTGSVTATVRSSWQTGQAKLGGNWRCDVGDPVEPALTSSSTLSRTVTGQSGMTYQIPTGWFTTPGSTLPATANTLLANASPQQMLDPCFSRQDSYGCNSALPFVRPNSMLISWHQGLLGPHPLVKPEGSDPFTTRAGTGWIESSTCAGSLGDVLLTVTVPTPQLSVTACVRGPDLLEMEQLARSVMASTTYPS